MFLDDLIASGAVGGLPPDLDSHIAFRMDNLLDAVPDERFGKLCEGLLSTTPINPPYPLTWFEYHVTDPSFRGGEHGFAVSVLTSGQMREIVADIERGEARAGVREMIGLGAHEFVTVSCFGRMFKQLYPICDCFIPIDRRGRMLPHPDGGFHHLTSDTRPEGIRTEDDVWTTVFALETGFFLAMLHVKNVLVVDHEIPEKMQRARIRRKKAPFFNYKTLRVVTPGSSLPTQGGGTQPPQEIAFHLVRGHWAHYTEERPLFGKYVGTWWIQPHTRGTPKVGVVFKDYDLVPRDPFDREGDGDGN